ncbi:peroxidase family 2 domain protein [Ceratobasidium sp. AG-Ba]|nr:peroxidase family 2 domain protein [Ceratobasidium sp. AG-Ba]
MASPNVFTTGKHIFVQAVRGRDSRSPCPALNTLANHGYLPHDGKNVSIFTLVPAIRKVYNFSFFHAFFLSCAGIFLCGRWLTLSFSLSDLAAPGKLEHDASLAHNDLDADVNVPAPELVEELIKDSKDGKTLTFRDLAEARVRRERTLPKPLDDFTAAVSRGEAINLLRSMGDGVRVSVDRVRIWLGEERLPDDYAPPKRQWGLRLGRQKRQE